MSENEKNNRVLSGIQPTGDGSLHIGVYLGMLKNAVELQKNYKKCYYPVVDLHALTQDFDPKENHQRILRTAMDSLAAGIDPNQSSLYQQSAVQEHASLAWVLNTLTSMGELERMTQYKDKAERQEHNINVGLFDYPVLMAADILLYKPAVVPVGEDQTQHIELTRTLARKFNNKFGDTFPIPKGIYTKAPRVMSLLDPEKKMSKSLGKNHCIFLTDEPEVIKKKLARAVTATESGGKEMPIGVKNLFTLLENFSSKDDLEHFSKQYKNGELKYQELKTKLAEIIADYFADFRQRRKELEQNLEKVEEVLEQGAKEAREFANQTWEEVKQKTGLAKM